MIRVFIADASQRILDNVTTRVGKEDDIMVCGTARDGEGAIQECLRLQPDVALLDTGLPSADGLQVTELLSQYLQHTGIIIMSLDVEQDLMRRAMLMGAREFLGKPFKGDELISSIRRVYKFEQKKNELATVGGDGGTTGDSSAPAGPTTLKGSVALVISAKGGVGKTVVATNLAVALGSMGAKTGLVDLSLQFGDVAMHLGLSPKRTLADLASSDAVADEDALAQTFGGAHGVKALLAPMRPEEADLITTGHVRALLGALRSQFLYTILDGPTHISELTLEALDLADMVIVVTDYTITSVKNTKNLLQVFTRLKIPPERLVILANDRDPIKGLTREMIISHLEWPELLSLEHDSQLVNTSIHNAVPFVISAPTSAVSSGIFTVARQVAPDLFPAAQPGPKAPAKTEPQPKKTKKRLGFART